jgi:methylthioribulose-1-phosphate dehydratase
MQFAEAAKQIVEAGRWLDARSWAPATSGNYSIRLDADRIAITASGRHKGRLIPDDVLVVDYDGGTSDARAPSAETPLHTLMYRLIPSLGAVLHIHSVHSTVLGMVLSGKTELELEGYELLKALPGIATHEARVSLPIFENTQNMAALARSVTERWKAGQTGQTGPSVGYLIRGHGLYTWGSTMEEAMRAVEALEFLFACELERRRMPP